MTNSHPPRILGCLAASVFLLAAASGCARPEPGSATGTSTAAMTTTTATTMAASSGETSSTTSTSEHRCSADASGKLSWSTGSLPPKHHHEWTFTFDGPRATFSVSPGYDSKITWKRTFTVDERIRSVCGEAHQIATRAISGKVAPGSQTGTVSITDGDTQIRSRHLHADDLAKLTALVKTVVPENDWRATMGEWEKWSEAQK